MKGQSSTQGSTNYHIKKLLAAYYIAHGTLLNATWQPGWEGSLGDNGTYICMSESLHCSPGAITALFANQLWSAVKVAQICPTLCDPMNYTVHAILQARILEWVVIPFSGGFSQPRDQIQVSRVAGGFFTRWATREAHRAHIWGIAHNQLWSCSVVSDSLWPHGHQAPPSVGFSRQEYWSGLLFPSPGDLPDPWIGPRDWTQVSHILDRCFTIWATREVYTSIQNKKLKKKKKNLLSTPQ